MLSKEENKKIEQAISNILRGIDIESSSLILEKAVLDNYIITSGRVNILHLAVRQILYFIENSKIQNVGDKSILDYVKENVKLKEEIKQLESDKQKLIEKLEKDKYTIESTYSQINGNYFMAQDKLDYIREILKILKGENHG